MPDRFVSRPIRTWELFCILALGQVASAAFLNRFVLSQMTSGLGGGGLEALGYLLSPVAFFLKAGSVSLLIQLSLLPFVRDPPLERVFRAALWGYGVLLLGNAFQAAWLSRVAPTQQLLGRLEALPGSLARAIPVALPSPFDILAQQLTLFDLAWPVVFWLTLDLGRAVRSGHVLLSVGTVWATLVLTRWAALLYLMRLA